MKIFLIILAILVALSAGIFVWYKTSRQTIIDFSPTPSAISTSLQSPVGHPPLESKERITKKPFGIYVTPQNSPVSPEKFTGYHTADDFETFPDEADKEMKVSAICDGTIFSKTTVSGYGGVIVQECSFNKLQSKVIYGHLDIDWPETKNTGDLVKTGDTIAILAQANSANSGGERKHLHLGILKTDQLDYRGYIQNQSELDQWYDPVALLNIP